MNTVFATESRFSVKNSEPLYIALPAYSSWQHLEITSGETYKHWSGLTLTLKPIGLEKRLTLFKMLHYFLRCHVRLGHRRSWRSAHFISSLLRKLSRVLDKEWFPLPSLYFRNFLLWYWLRAKTKTAYSLWYLTYSLVI